MALFYGWTAGGSEIDLPYLDEFPALIDSDFLIAFFGGAISNFQCFIERFMPSYINLIVFPVLMNTIYICVHQKLLNHFTRDQTF